MKRLVAGLLLLGFLACGNLAFAQEPCECEKGGIGLFPSRSLTLGIGWKIIHSGDPECITGKNIGITIGGINQFVSIGVGYDTGVVGVGIGIKSTGSFIIISPFAIGYDYGPCPVTWPIHIE